MVVFGVCLCWSSGRVASYWWGRWGLGWVSGGHVAGSRWLGAPRLNTTKRIIKKSIWSKVLITFNPSSFCTSLMLWRTIIITVSGGHTWPGHPLHQGLAPPFIRQVIPGDKPWRSSVLGGGAPVPPLCSERFRCCFPCEPRMCWQGLATLCDPWLAWPRLSMTCLGWPRGMITHHWFDGKMFSAWH